MKLILILGMVLALTAANDFPSFVDVAAKAGITLMNVNGEAPKDYIVEANGNGAAFFDFDNDGDMDVLIANGSTIANYRKGGDPMLALYKNNGGTFTDGKGGLLPLHLNAVSVTPLELDLTHELSLNHLSHWAKLLERPAESKGD